MKNFAFFFLYVSPYDLAFFYLSVSGLSVTAGAHRLWCHRSYKARWPLRAFLMLANCCVAQNDIYDWVRWVLFVVLQGNFFRFNGCYPELWSLMTVPLLGWCLWSEAHQWRFAKIVESMMEACDNELAKSCRSVAVIVWKNDSSSSFVYGFVSTPRSNTIELTYKLTMSKW